jgi:predicted RNA-binding Zn-ribbon protein involved in translation (DUF1610 family)
MYAGVFRMSQSGECTRCHAPLHALAAYCGRCGMVVARKPQAQVPDDLRRLADQHRSLVRVFAVFFIVEMLFGVGLGPITPIFQTVLAVVWFILLVPMLSSVLTLSDAVRHGVVFSAILTFLIVVPFLNVLIVLWLSWRARQELRAAGIQAGFLGGRSLDFETAVYLHHCRSCGYDLRGLTSLKCPECGLAFAALRTANG